MTEVHSTLSALWGLVGIVVFMLIYRAIVVLLRRIADAADRTADAAERSARALEGLAIRSEPPSRPLGATEEREG